MEKLPTELTSHIHSLAALLGTPVQLLITQMSKQPITCQQFSEFKTM